VKAALGRVAAAALLAASCGPARLPPPTGEPGAEPGTPLSEEERRGLHVYMRHCHACHPGGAAGLGPSLVDKPLPGAVLKLQVRQGLGAMPAFGEDRIAEDELDALAAYVAALRRR
jgi:mono/diheme cytochrome c family protein